MKKVIQLISSMNTGGAETLVKDYALLMDKEQVNMIVVVLSGRYHSNNEKLLEENGIRVIFLEELLYGDRKDLNLVQMLIRKVSRYVYFRKIVLEEKPDVIHVHLYMGGYLKTIPLNKMNIKLFYTVHNILPNYFDKRFSFKRKSREYREAKHHLKKDGMTLIALHESMNVELKEFFNTDNVITINNGVVLDRFKRELYNREVIREQIGFNKDDFVIGHVGRYHTQKNHELIIDIFENTLRIKPNAKLLLIGKGELKEEIKSKINKKGLSDKVVLLEERKDIPELMCAMDVFLFPSRWEGFPVTLIEAQSMGLKCVISDTISKEVSITGLVIKKSLDDSLDEWSEAILHTQVNRSDVGDLNEYDIKTSIKKLQDMYCE